MFWPAIGDRIWMACAATPPRKKRIVDINASFIVIYY
jgi:hypothetical protein